MIGFRFSFRTTHDLEQFAPLNLEFGTNIIRGISEWISNREPSRGSSNLDRRDHRISWGSISSPKGYIKRYS